MTTIDQRTGTIEEKGEPLQTLVTYRGARGGTYFGANIVIDTMSVLRQGDQLYAP
jgi:uncharacterized protein YcbX